MALNIGKSVNVYEQLRNVNAYWVTWHLHDVLGIHEEIFICLAKRSIRYDWHDYFFCQY